jgi:C4-dicarboxylate transporter DctQ subunit
MKILRAIDRVVRTLERSLVVTILSGMVLVAFAQVILRNLFSTGMLWADPMLRHAVLWIGFLGASIATRQERHIAIDLVTRFTTPATSNRIRILTNLVAAIVCAFLARAAWTFVQSEREFGSGSITMGSFDFPLWWLQVIIPIGFSLMAFRFTLRIIERLRAGESADTESAIPQKPRL